MLKNILYTVCSLSLFVFATAAFADVDYGATPDYGGFGDNSANVTIPTSGTSITTKSGTLNINANGTTLQLNKSGTGSSMTVTVDGKTVDLNSSEGSLSVQEDKGLSDSDEKTFISLKGNSDLLIKSEADLSAYNKLIIKQRPVIENVSVKNNGLQIKYSQPAKFFGIFSSHLGATVTVASDGTVSIDLPWYSFLYSKNSDEVQTAIETSLGQAESSHQVDLNLIGTSGKTGSVEVGTDTGDNSTIQFRNNAHALNVVTNSIDGTVGLSASE